MVRSENDNYSHSDSETHPVLIGLIWGCHHLFKIPLEVLGMEEHKEPTWGGELTSVVDTE